MSPDRYLKWADCIILVYSITSRQSYLSSLSPPYLASWTGYVNYLETHPRKRRASHELATPGSESSARVATPCEIGIPPALIIVGAKCELEVAR